MSTLSDLRPAYDVAVVGARCAGAATAMLLARMGASVLVVDRDAPGADTLSTLALMRAGVLQLHRWGLLDAVRAANTPPVRRTCFHYGRDVVEVPIKPRDGVDALYAPRRTVLDPLLADAAREAGADVRYGLRLVELMRDGNGGVAGLMIADRAGRTANVRTGLVVGADGRVSNVARQVAARAYVEGPHRSAVVYGLFAGLEQDGYHWMFVPGWSVGLIPTNDGLTIVFAATAADRFMREMRGDLAAAHRRVLAETAPDLAATMTGATQVGRLWGFSGLNGYMRQSWGPGWALVGDAGYFKDPITAHGITDALRDAELLARAAHAGTAEAFAEYQSVRDSLSRELFDITDTVASFAWDLETVRERHHVMSKEMSGEARWLAALGPLPAASGQAFTGAAASS